MLAYCDLEEVETRLEFPLDEDLKRVALASIEDASVTAAHIAGQAWASYKAPDIVRVIVAAAVVRYLRNPDNYIQSRAGDETVVWADPNGRAPLDFTDRETRLLKDWGKRSGGYFGSVGTFAHRGKPLPADGFVKYPSPTQWFPLFGEGDSYLWSKK